MAAGRDALEWSHVDKRDNARKGVTQTLVRKKNLGLFIETEIVAFRTIWITRQSVMKAERTKRIMTLTLKRALSIHKKNCFIGVAYCGDTIDCQDDNALSTALRDDQSN